MPVPPIGRRKEKRDDIAPDGSEIRLIVGPEEGATKAGLCEVTLAAGGVSRPVQHQKVEEIWYVLEGTGHVWRSPPGDEKHEPIEVRPGDALTIPTLWHFQFRASSSGPLKFLCYTAPQWPGPDEARPVPKGGLGQPTR